MPNGLSSVGRGIDLRSRAIVKARVVEERGSIAALAKPARINQSKVAKVVEGVTRSEVQSMYVEGCALNAKSAILLLKYLGTWERGTQRWF